MSSSPSSSVNTGSVGIHTSMGFEMLEGDGAAGGVSVLHHYDGDRKDKVVFAKEIGLSSHTFYRDPSAES